MSRSGRPRAIANSPPKLPSSPVLHSRSQQSPRLVLASASPRRRELLALLNVDFDVTPVEVDESFGPAARDPRILARRLAREKAEAARFVVPDSPVLAADTIVWLDGRAFGKPSDADEAREMLRSLRGRTHRVVTAVALIPGRHRSALVREPVTEVEMRDYSDAEIEQSVRRGDPFDKAGGYGIQDEGLKPVAAYSGCYCNVVGLSLWATLELMRKAGILPAGTTRFLPQCQQCPERPG